MKWLVLAALGAGSANATTIPLTQSCILEVGSTVGTHSTRDLAEVLRDAPVKDEFISTDQHSAKLDAFVASLPTPARDGQLCVSPIADQAIFDYDADAQLLWVNVEAASGTRGFRSSAGKVTVRDVVSDEWDTVLADRVMTNALGVSVDGISSTSKTASVGFTTTQMNTFHQSLQYHRFKSAFPSKAFSMSMESSVAREVKPHAAIVYQYRLRSPLLAEGTDVHAATMDSPVSFAVEKSVVLADLVAVGVVDGRTGEVLAVIHTEEKK